MSFAKLFPPVSDDGSDECCTIEGQTVLLKGATFTPIAQRALPSATWIDGGSTCIFSTPSRCIGLIKVCAVHTEALERREIAVHTYLVSVTRSNGTFVVRNQCAKNPHEAIDAALHRDISLKEVTPDATPESLLDVLRSLAEQSIASDLTIHDGSSRTLHPYLQKHGKKMHALAKTTELLTTRSRPLSFALLQYAPSGTWCAELAPGFVCARLHPRASHVFLVEQATPELLALLQAWSADMAFPGYPYPLVLADQLGRVTNNERDAWRAVIGSDADAAKILSGEVKATNAHDILEHILYGKPMY